MAANAVKNSRCVVTIVLLVFPQLLFGVGLRSGDVIATDVSVVVAGVHLSLDDGTSHWDFVGVGRSVRHRPLAQSSKIRWVCAVRINQRNGVMVAVQFVVDFIVGDDLASVYIVVHFRLGQEFPGLEVEDQDALRQRFGVCPSDIHSVFVDDAW